MIDFYQPSLSNTVWTYFRIIPIFILGCALINTAFNAAGFDAPPFYVSQVLAFMYEGYIASIHGATNDSK